jgi:diaminopimelate epimerase
VRFAKLHGAGNDFLLFDGRDDPLLESALPAIVPRLCERRLGVGADGVLLLLPREDRAVRLLYWNRDGSPAAFCANGTRCAARYAAERWGWPAVTIDTGHATVAATVCGADVTLHLPPPEVVQPWRRLAAAAETVACRYLVVGVPHLVVPVDWPDFWQRPLAPLAPALRAHPALPAGGANVHFVQRPAAGPLAIRSFERGVEGETLSCGSGVVATALIAAAEGWRRSPVELLTASQRVLTVRPEGTPPACPVSLIGPAEWVCEGDVAPDLLLSVPGPRSPVPGLTGS